ncbi:MAG: hypothetical protein AAGU77_07440 [Bacillota bacterium]
MKHTWRSVPVLLLILCLLAFSVACGSKAPDKSGDSGLFAVTDDAKKSGLAGLLAAPTPEPTPVPLSVQFQAGLEKVLKDAVAKSGDIGDAGLGFLLNPEGGEDEKSSRAETVVGITQGDNEEQTVKTVTLMDKSTGDASFTIAAVEGAETAGEGGMYFTGDTMLLKRADASAPLIRFLPDAALAASYQNQTALSRAALALSEEQKPVQSEEEWGDRIASFAALVLAQSTQSDYAEDTTELALPGGSGADTITLTLGGDAARAVLTEYVALLSDNGGISGMLDAIETEDQEETGVKRLDALQSSIQDAGDLSLTAALILYEDDPIGVDLAFTLDGEQNAWRLLFYERGFERRNELSFLFGDGATVTMLDTNKNTGGDSYAGEVTVESAQPNGERASVTFQSDSTNTDAFYDMTGTLAFTQTKLDDGSLDTQSGDVSVTWKQQKNASGGVDASGTVAVTSDDDTVNVSIQYSKTCGDASVEAPQFIEGAGVSASSREEVFDELDIDTEEFDALPTAYRGLMLLMALTNG